MLIGILDTLSTPPRGKRLLQRLSNGGRQFGHDVEAYNGRGLLVMYGPGGPDRLQAASRHNGNYIAWDAGYWNRKTFDRSFRVTLNGLHP